MIIKSSQNSCSLPSSTNLVTHHIMHCADHACGHAAEKENHNWDDWEGARLTPGTCSLTDWKTVIRRQKACGEVPLMGKQDRKINILILEKTRLCCDCWRRKKTSHLKGMLGRHHVTFSPELATAGLRSRSWGLLAGPAQLLNGLMCYSSCPVVRVNIKRGISLCLSVAFKSREPFIPKRLCSVIVRLRG